MKIVCTYPKEGEDDSKEKKEKLKLEMFLKIIEMIGKGYLNNKAGSDLILFLRAKLEQSSVAISIKVCNKVIEEFKEGEKGSARCLEFLVAAFQSIKDNNKIEGETGKTFKNKTFNTIIESKWHETSIPIVLNFFKEIGVEEEILERVLSKTLEQLKTMTIIQEFPPLVHQMLLLFKKNNQKNLILSEISSFFTRLESEHSKENRDSRFQDTQQEHSQAIHQNDSSLNNILATEGSVIIDIDFSIKQDFSIGDDFVKALEKNPSILSPFNISILLSASRIPKFTDKIFNFLKQTLVCYFKEKVLKDKCEWIKNAVSVKPKSNLKSVLLDTLNKSQKGSWDTNFVPLINFSFKILDPSTSKLELFQSKDAYENLSEFAVDLLYKLFSSSASSLGYVRSQILDQLIQRILNSEGKKCYLILLEKLIHKQSDVMKKEHDKINQIFDYLFVMNELSSRKIINTLIPLIPATETIRDHFLMISKKLLQVGELSSKIISVHALSKLIFSFQNNYPGQDHQKIIFEIFLLLTKSLNSQQRVRFEFYRAIPNITIFCTFLSDSIFKILYCHLSKFFVVDQDKWNDGVIFDLHSCLDSSDDPVIVEPIPELIRCITRCLVLRSKMRASESTKSQEHLDYTDSEKLVQMTLLAIYPKLIEYNSLDFKLGKKIKFKTKKNKKIKNKKNKI